MKHGKASKKARAAKKGQAKGGGKAQKQTSPSKESRPTKESRVQAAAPAAPIRRPADAKGGRIPPPGGFTNPLIASAYKRALKKYSAALKRLTD